MAAAAGAPPADSRLRALYSVMQSIENKLGGGEGVEGLYGSIKRSGMDKVLACLGDKCGLDGRSVLVDVGAGLGRPLMHALLEPGIAGARGIEIDRIKVDKAEAFLKQAIAELQRRGVADAGLAPPPIECSAIEHVRTLDGCTHAYSFWEGVPVEGKAAFGRLFAASRTMRSVAVVQRAIRTDPAAYMEDLGFGELALVGSFPVSMSGSGRSFTAYVFNKAQLPAQLAAPLAADTAAAQSVETPAQAAEAAAAALTVAQGAVAPAPEVEGDSAQSRGGRGRRQRRPTAKQAAAAEQAAEERAERQQQQQLSARELRAVRRNEAVYAAAQTSRQPAAPAAMPGSPGKSARSRSVPRAAPAAAGKLSSPQKGGVQKRQSPVKQVPVKSAGSVAGPRRSPRRLALADAEAPEQAAPAAAAPPAAALPGGSPGKPSRRRAAAAAAQPAAAAQLGSPQRGAVHKVAAPSPRRGEARRLALLSQQLQEAVTLEPAAQAAAAAPPAPAAAPRAPAAAAPGAGLVGRTMRVIKSGIATGVAKAASKLSLSPRKQPAAAAEAAPRGRGLGVRSGGRAAP